MSYDSGPHTPFPPSTYVVIPHVCTAMSVKRFKTTIFLQNNIYMVWKIEGKVAKFLNIDICLLCTAFICFTTSDPTSRIQSLPYLSPTDQRSNFKTITVVKSYKGWRHAPHSFYLFLH
jgi:hypothetical protein